MLIIVKYNPYIYLIEMYYSVFNTDTGTNPNFVGRGLGEGRPNAKIFLSDFRKLLKMNWDELLKDW